MSLKRGRIIWFDVPMKEGFDNHWTKEGRVDGERRFLLFCPKDEPIRVMLKDMKTGFESEVEPGSFNAGFRLANRLLGKEKKRWDGENCKMCGREQRLAWNVKKELWINVMGKKNKDVVCLECFISEADKKGINVKFSAFEFFGIVGQNIKGDILIN